MLIVVDYEVTTSYKSYIPLPVVQYKRETDKNIHPYLISTREIAFPSFISPIRDLKPEWNIDETLTSFKDNDTFFYLINISLSKNLLQRIVLKNYQKDLILLGHNPKSKATTNRYPTPDFMRHQQEKVLKLSDKLLPGFKVKSNEDQREDVNIFDGSAVKISDVQEDVIDDVNEYVDEDEFDIKEEVSSDDEFAMSEEEEEDDDNN